jgi:hypothetical protein
LGIAKARFKRSLLGYRRAAVDAAVAESEQLIALQDAEIKARSAELAGRERRIEELERVADRLSERVVEGEGELRRLRAELARISGAGDAHLATLSAVLGELEEVRRTARGQATRIRLSALREAAELSERVGELTKRPAGMREGMLEALTEAIARIGGGEERVAVPDELAVADEVAATNGHPEAAGPELFDGLVELEIGPLSDFAQLVGFEDAAKAVAPTAEITVKRFSDGRATLELSLSEPVALLRELDERCDIDFAVRDQRDDHVVLDVGE